MKHLRKSIAVLFALAMLATTAGPAAAVGTGVLQGVAKVGKQATICRHDGTSDVGGAGIGLPGIPPTKNAYYSIDTNDPLTPGTLVVVKAAKPNTGVYTGILRACGRLGPVGQSPAPQLGAACGISKGYHGKGRVTYTSGDKNGQIYSLHDITWKSSVGGTFPFYASGQPGTIDKGASGRDLVTGVIQTVAGGGGTPEEGLLGCALKSQKEQAQPGSKTDGQNVGGRRFAVNGTFDIVNNAWVDPQGDNTTAGICKRTGDPTCLYKDKKPQTPKDDD